MTSKLTSHTLCAHSSNDGDFEFGGLGVKGCCGKVRWNTVRQGEIWINGVFCEDEFLTSNHNPNAIGFQTAPESCKNEHSEVDWISKEISFQELICNDRSSHWSKSNTGENDFVKEEHDIDIISTLTAVAALLRDRCAVETDISEPPVKDKFEKSSNLKKDTKKELVWINDAKVEASKATDAPTDLPMQNDVLKWSNYDLAWEGFVKEHLKSQQLLCHALFHHGLMGKEVASESSWFPDIAAFQEDAKACQGFSSTVVYPRSKPEEQSQSHRHPLKYNREVAESGDTCIRDQFGMASLSATHMDQTNCLEPFVDMDRYVIFGRQSPAASRYSFGREGGSISEVGKMLPPVIPEEKLVNDFSFEEGLALVDENLNGTGFSIDIEDGSEEEAMKHEALLYALSYMSLQDLLTMEKVCRSLRDWIRNDVLLWQQLHIEPPLSKSFTDEVLLELASRAKGQLQCLSLVDCTRVTEVAVEQVVSANPRLSKAEGGMTAVECPDSLRSCCLQLCLPGCSRVSADAVVRMVEILTSHKRPGMPGLKQLRVRNIYGLTREHLESLQNMVGVSTQDQSSSRKSQYYHNGHYASWCDDERPIDVEECPKCTNARLVYDCTRERCQQRQGIKLQECRACILCIVRCEECGRCINDNDYEETFSLDLLCSCCWLRLPKCAECNRPGCGRHADHFIRTPETTFVCSDCCGTSLGTTGPEFHVYA